MKLKKVLVVACVVSALTGSVFATTQSVALKSEHVDYSGEFGPEAAAPAGFWVGIAVGMAGNAAYDVAKAVATAVYDYVKENMIQVGDGTTSNPSHNHQYVPLPASALD